MLAFHASRRPQPPAPLQKPPLARAREGRGDLAMTVGIYRWGHRGALGGVGGAARCRAARAAVGEGGGGGD